jgi:hypothetical protein
MVAEGLWSGQTPAGLVHAYVFKPITADAQHGSAIAFRCLGEFFHRQCRHGIRHSYSHATEQESAPEKHGESSAAMLLKLHFSSRSFLDQGMLAAIRLHKII